MVWRFFDDVVRVPTAPIKSAVNLFRADCLEKIIPALSDFGVLSKLDVPMDITISMQSKDNVLVSSANSFNNHGPITGFYRFIGEEETYLIEKPVGLVDHEGNPVATEPFNGADEEFIESIREGREPLTSVQSQLHVMDVLDRIQKSIDEKR